MNTIRLARFILVNWDLLAAALTGLAAWTACGMLLAHLIGRWRR